MVDVGDKSATRRFARAGGRIAMQPATLALIRAGDAKKGDVLGVARIAAICCVVASAAQKAGLDPVGEAVKRLTTEPSLANPSGRVICR